MNRNEDRWRQCYWKEWAAIKKRWDDLDATWRERVENGASQSEVEAVASGGASPA
ncbi:MAG: hypothetical protein ACREYC_18590 [Gammaproteobacteria bacterium]